MFPISMLLLLIVGCQDASLSAEEPAMLEETLEAVEEVITEETDENLVRRGASDRLPGSLKWGSIIIFQAGDDFLLDHPEGLRAANSVLAEVETGDSGKTPVSTGSAAEEKTTQKPADTTKSDPASESSSISAQQTIHWKSGIYTGSLKNGVPHGQGKLTVPGGEQYIGTFQEGSITGYGTMIFPSGTKYVGNFKDGIAHGQGTMTNPNGGTLTGTWNNGNYVE